MIAGLFMIACCGAKARAIFNVAACLCSKCEAALRRACNSAPPAVGSYTFAKCADGILAPRARISGAMRPTDRGGLGLAFRLANVPQPLVLLVQTVLQNPDTRLTAWVLGREAEPLGAWLARSGAASASLKAALPDSCATALPAAFREAFLICVRETIDAFLYALEAGREAGGAQLPQDALPQASNGLSP